MPIFCRKLQKIVIITSTPGSAFFRPGGVVLLYRLCLPSDETKVKVMHRFGQQKMARATFWATFWATFGPHFGRFFSRNSSGHPDRGLEKP
jgi:hypothetical protein